MTAVRFFKYRDIEMEEPFNLRCTLCVMTHFFDSVYWTQSSKLSALTGAIKLMPNFMLFGPFKGRRSLKEDM